MKKETIEIKAAYVAPEVKAFAIQPSVAMMSNIEGMNVDDEPWEWEEN